MSLTHPTVGFGAATSSGYTRQRMFVTVLVTFVQLPELAEATMVVPFRACATAPAALALAMDPVTKLPGRACVAQVPHDSLVPLSPAPEYAQIEPVAQVPTERGLSD